MLQKKIFTDLRDLLPFLLLLFISLHAFAEQTSAQNLQRMSIEREDAGTGIPVFTEHPDKAGIVIESSVPGLRFSSNMQGIVEVKEPAAGRYVLIIEPFTQIIRVDAENFVQERFRVGNPQARDVLYFSVTPEQQQSDLISVIFNVEPEDASLFLDGQQVETNTTVQLPTQGYELRLEREGYRSINEVVNVTPENIQFNYRMEEIDIVPVRIRSNVEGASVIIDGTERGKIDRSGMLSLFLYPGSYALSMSRSGYVTDTASLDVTMASENRFTVNLQRNIGELALNITPDDAQIALNRQDYSGEYMVELAPGLYRLDVLKEGYAPYTETIEIERNDRLVRNISLEAYTGSFQFSVSPGNASVILLDGTGAVVERWQGINLLRNLKVGRYTLQVEAEEHLSVEENVQIARDERLEYSVSLVEETHWNCNKDTETEVVEVTNPETGRTWMDRNLGASRAATSRADEQAYGDLYQWGRAADSHQNRNSSTTSTLSSSDQPGHGSFITSSIRDGRDWRLSQNNNLWQGVNGTNNPCPAGYRIPTGAEWDAELNSWSSKNATGAFNSPLKLPMAGLRSGGSVYVGNTGNYWSASLSGSLPLHLYFESILAFVSTEYRAFGYSIRCIKD
jgi:uncharacterized protein (TIGR02145 family)